MTKEQINEAVFHPEPAVHLDRRPFWKRFLASLKIDIKPVKLRKQTVVCVAVKGGFEF